MLTIGQLAKKADVPISTVRYYEGRGLLRPDGRTASSYRLFGPKTLHQLRFIRAAQSSGFTLEDIARLLELRAGEADPCGEVRELILTRLESIEEELSRLRHVRGVLKETVAWCDKPRAKGCCEAVSRLDKEAANPKPTRGAKGARGKARGKGK